MCKGGIWWLLQSSEVEGIEKGPFPQAFVAATAVEARRSFVWPNDKVSQVHAHK